MKLVSAKTLVFLSILIAGSTYIISCKHDDELPPPPATTGPVITRGTNIHLPGNMTTGVTTEWKLDKTHSSTLWQTNYVGAAGLLTGRFNQFGMHDITDAKMLNFVTAAQPLKDTSWAFYENEPSKTYFNGYVQINTSNTGEPGRDAGCNVAGMNTVAIVAGTQNLTFVNLAKIQTTKVEFDALTNGYIVTMNLTWHGSTAGGVTAVPVTKSIVGKLNYITKTKVQFGTSAAYEVFGLQLKFQFNCRDFGITSTSISDKLEIECNMNFNNK